MAPTQHREPANRETYRTAFPTRLRPHAPALQMYWAATSSLGDSAVSFTGINENLYQPPDGFCEARTP
jgi:hypothetical protein